MHKLYHGIEIVGVRTSHLDKVCFVYRKKQIIREKQVFSLSLDWGYNKLFSANPEEKNSIFVLVKAPQDPLAHPSNKTVEKIKGIPEHKCSFM